MHALHTHTTVKYWIIQLDAQTHMPYFIIHMCGCVVLVSEALLFINCSHVWPNFDWVTWRVYQIPLCSVWRLLLGCFDCVFLTVQSTSPWGLWGTASMNTCSSHGWWPASMMWKPGTCTLSLYPLSWTNWSGTPPTDSPISRIWRMADQIAKCNTWWVIDGYIYWALSVLLWKFMYWSDTLLR